MEEAYTTVIELINAKLTSLQKLRDDFNSKKIPYDTEKLNSLILNLSNVQAEIYEKLLKG